MSRIKLEVGQSWEVAGYHGPWRFTFVSCVRTSVTYRIESTNGKVAVAQVTRQRGYFVEDPREWVALAWEVLSSHEGAAVLRFLGLEGSV